VINLLYYSGIIFFATENNILFFICISLQSSVVILFLYIFIMANLLQANELSVEAEANRFMQRVYAWMAFALVVSGGIAFYVSTDLRLIEMIFTN
jgi:hypothetical protein